MDASTLGADDHAAVLKAIVDWFALLASERLVYTYQSSFGKTAAEASDAPNLDVNYTRCLAADERWGDGEAPVIVPPWVVEWAEAGGGVAYDVSRVPGAKEPKPPQPLREEL